MESIGRTTVTAAGSLWRKLGETCLEQISTGRKTYQSQKEGMGWLSAKGMYSEGLGSFHIRHRLAVFCSHFRICNGDRGWEIHIFLHSYLCHNKESLQSDRFCKGLRCDICIFFCFLYCKFITIYFVFERIGSNVTKLYQLLWLMCNIDFRSLVLLCAESAINIQRILHYYVENMLSYFFFGLHCNCFQAQGRTIFFYFPIYLQSVEIHSANDVLGSEGG
jgi:hypothetical protein